MSKNFDWSQFEDAIPSNNNFGWNQFEEVLPAQGVGPSGMPFPDEPSSVQWGQILRDIASSPYEAGRMFGGALKNLPSQISDLASQSFGRAAQSAGRGLYGSLKQIPYIDENINQYLASRGLPKVIPAIGKELREIGESENARALDSAIMGALTPEDSRPGDALVESLAAFLPYSKLGGRGALAAQAVASNQNPLAAALIPTGVKGTLEAIPVVKNIVSDIIKAPNRERAASKLAEGYNQAKSVSSAKFQKVLSDAKELGIEPAVAVPYNDIRAIAKGGGGKYLKYAKKAGKTSTPEVVHRAQSDLGKFIRSKEGAIEAGKAPAEVIEAVGSARKVQRDLKKALLDSFDASGNKHLIDALRDADKHYVENIVPFQDLAPLRKYIKGKMSGADLVKDLVKNKSFNKNFSGQYPEIDLSHALTGYGQFDPLIKTLKAGKNKLFKSLESSEGKK